MPKRKSDEKAEGLQAKAARLEGEATILELQAANLEREEDKNDKFIFTQFNSIEALNSDRDAYRARATAIKAREEATAEVSRAPKTAAQPKGKRKENAEITAHPIGKSKGKQPSRTFKTPKKPYDPADIALLISEGNEKELKKTDPKKFHCGCYNTDSNRDLFSEQVHANLTKKDFKKRAYSLFINLLFNSSETKKSSIMRHQPTTAPTPGRKISPRLQKPAGEAGPAKQPPPSHEEIDSRELKYVIDRITENNVYTINDLFHSEYYYDTLSKKNKEDFIEIVKSHLAKTQISNEAAQYFFFHTATQPQPTQPSLLTPIYLAMHESRTKKEFQKIIDGILKDLFSPDYDWENLLDYARTSSDWGDYLDVLLKKQASLLIELQQSTLRPAETKGEAIVVIDQEETTAASPTIELQPSTSSPSEDDHAVAIVQGSTAAASPTAELPSNTSSQGNSKSNTQNDRLTVKLSQSEHTASGDTSIIAPASDATGRNIASPSPLTTVRSNTDDTAVMRPRSVRDSAQRAERKIFDFYAAAEANEKKEKKEKKQPLTMKKPTGQPKGSGKAAAKDATALTTHSPIDKLNTMLSQIIKSKLKKSTASNDLLHRLQYHYGIINGSTNLEAVIYSTVRAIQIIQEIETPPSRDVAELQNKGYTQQQLWSMCLVAEYAAPPANSSPSLSATVYAEMLKLMLTLLDEDNISILDEVISEHYIKQYKTNPFTVFFYKPMIDAVLSESYQQYAFFKEGKLTEELRIQFSTLIEVVAPIAERFELSDITYAAAQPLTQPHAMVNNYKLQPRLEAQIASEGASQLKERTAQDNKVHQTYQATEQTEVTAQAHDRKRGHDEIDDDEATAHELSKIEAAILLESLAKYSRLTSDGDDDDRLNQSSDSGIGGDSSTPEGNSGHSPQLFAAPQTTVSAEPREATRAPTSNQNK